MRGPLFMRQALDPDRAAKHARFRTAVRNLRTLAESGVRIGLATGSGLPNTFEGYDEYRECALMRSAGISPMEVIRAVSSGSAAALGLDAELGTVRPGARADLVILNADPRANIHNLRDLHAVLVGGALVPL